MLTGEQKLLDRAVVLAAILATQATSDVETLTLEGNPITGTTDQVDRKTGMVTPPHAAVANMKPIEYLGLTLKDRFYKIKVLSVSNCGLGPRGLELLTAGLAGVTSLDLSYNRLICDDGGGNSAGWEALGAVISTPTCTRTITTCANP